MAFFSMALNFFTCNYPYCPFLSIIIHAPSFSIRPFLFGCSLHSFSLWFPIFNYTDVGLITSYVLQNSIIINSQLYVT